MHRCLKAVPALVVTVSFSICSSIGVAEAGRSSGSRQSIVWAVFFSSSDCEMCRSVKSLTKKLKQRYPVRFKTFDIDRAADFALFERLEAIHATSGFSVPLIMVGDTIMIGERDISARLERTVRRLARRGGASLPYLGPKSKPKPVAAKPKRSRCDCERTGRPPTIGEGLAKVKSFLDRLF